MWRSPRACTASGSLPTGASVGGVSTPTNGPSSDDPCWSGRVHTAELKGATASFRGAAAEPVAVRPNKDGVDGPSTRSSLNHARAALGDVGGAGEIRMFGGLCFAMPGNLVVGVTGDDVMVRSLPMGGGRGEKRMPRRAAPASHTRRSRRRAPAGTSPLRRRRGSRGSSRPQRRAPWRPLPRYHR